MRSEFPTSATSWISRVVAWFQPQASPKPASIPPSLSDQAEADRSSHQEGLNQPNLNDVLEDLANLAALICEASIGVISLAQEERQWFTARTAVSEADIARALSFCAHTNSEPGLILVPNLLDDPHFSHNAIARCDPPLKFFAGIPLINSTGLSIGRLCLLDQAVKNVSQEQREALATLARQVVTQLDLRKTMGDLTKTLTQHSIVQRRQNAQYSIARILADSSSLADATPRLLQAICSSLDWQVGALWKVDDEAKVLRCVELWHTTEGHFPAFEKISRDITFAPGIGLPGRVWLSRDAAWIPDVLKDANFPRLKVAAEEGLHGAFGFPVQWQKKVLGVLEFFSPEIRPPDPDLLQMFTAIGSQIGQFTERMRVEAEQNALIVQLQAALTKVKTLSGLLPICASCKKVRDDKGYWHRIEKYIESHSEAEVSHGLCRECARKLYPEYYKDVERDPSES